MDIYDQIEHFSLIPRLGYWTYDKDIDEFYWSKETCELVKWPLDKPSPKFKEFLSIVHEQDHQEMINAVTELYTGTSDGYGHELRIKTPNSDEYKWYHVIGRANKNLLFGIIIDINKRKTIEFETKQLHKQLLTFAKQAGMAEVAISVIHNIGNVLNGATTSISFLEDKIHKTSYKKFLDITALLKEHKLSLSTYLTEDPKGKKIPEYLIALGELMDNECQSIIKEIHNISECIGHIKNIIGTQESVSNTCSIKEKVVVSETLDSAIKFFYSNVTKSNITINKHYQEDMQILVDKSKLMQILVNLIKNAIDSVSLDTKQPTKEINISIVNSSNMLTIIIQDNGLGIDQENINKIFSFGFTTKTDGHGFGLHNSALKAKEMGGSLQAKSDGIGCGATFTLTLPYNPEKNKNTSQKPV